MRRLAVHAVRLVCAYIGHRGLVTASVRVGGADTWHQETCTRCGARRQYMSHAWGRSEATLWWHPAHHDEASGAS